MVWLWRARSGAAAQLAAVWRAKAGQGGPRHGGAHRSTRPARPGRPWRASKPAQPGRRSDQIHSGPKAEWNGKSLPAASPPTHAPPAPPCVFESLQKYSRRWGLSIWVGRMHKVRWASPAQPGVWAGRVGSRGPSTQPRGAGCLPGPPRPSRHASAGVAGRRAGRKGSRGERAHHAAPHRRCSKLYIFFHADPRISITLCLSRPARVAAKRPAHRCQLPTADADATLTPR